ncbi:MAG: phospholipase D family protein [Planctomycetes bacterium]|nr:phospholipase D family protein [Planctomycetota bacterium]
MRFVLNPSGVFHPKVYLFERGARWECVVGSPNFTGAGLGSNDEVAVLISDRDPGAADAHRSLTRTIHGYWARGSRMDAAGVEKYRAMWSDRLRLRSQLGDASMGARPQRDRGRGPLEMPVLRMTWREFVAKVRAERNGTTLATRLAVLESAHKQFRRYKSLRLMDELTRKRIAGTTYEADDPRPSAPKWMWFGSMRGHGNFKAAVARNSRALSDALDQIPPDGDVTREQYGAFVQKFTAAFASVRGARGGVGTATRLLAMKRPDRFVCVNSRNRRGLSQAFCIRGSIEFEEYWDSIVDRVRSAPWFSVGEPEGDEDAAIWRGRAAMMDAVYYEHP